MKKVKKLSVKNSKPKKLVIKISKQLKLLKKKRRLRNKKIRLIAKGLRRLHHKHERLSSLRKVIPYTTKHDMLLFRFLPAYPLLRFKSDLNLGSWKLVKTCRLPSLLMITFNIVDYNEQKDYFTLRSPDIAGSHHYSRYELEPFRKKRLKMRHFIRLAGQLLNLRLRRA